MIQIPWRSRFGARGLRLIGKRWTLGVCWLPSGNPGWSMSNHHLTAGRLVVDWTTRGRQRNQEQPQDELRWQSLSQALKEDMARRGLLFEDGKLSDYARLTADSLSNANHDERKP